MRMIEFLPNLRLIALLFSRVFIIGCLPEFREWREYTIKVGSTTFQFPEEYLLRSHLRNEVERTVALAVVYPEFVPQKTNERLLRRQGRMFDGITILISETSKYQSLKSMREIYSETQNVTQRMGIKHSLEVYASASNPTSGPEIYVEAAGDQPEKGWIKCIGVNYTVNPQCSAFYWFGDYYIEIGYDMDWLPEWRRIKNESIALIEKFKKIDMGNHK